MHVYRRKCNRICLETATNSEPSYTCAYNTKGAGSELIVVRRMATSSNLPTPMKSHGSSSEEGGNNE